MVGGGRTPGRRHRLVALCRRLWPQQAPGDGQDGGAQGKAAQHGPGDHRRRPEGRAGEARSREVPGCPATPDREVEGKRAANRAKVRDSVLGGRYGDTQQLSRFDDARS